MQSSLCFLDPKARVDLNDHSSPVGRLKLDRYIWCESIEFVVSPTQMHHEKFRGDISSYIILIVMPKIKSTI